jgi:hypothetical protein
MPSILNSDSGAVSGSAGLKFDAADDGILEIQNSGNTAIKLSDSFLKVPTGNTAQRPASPENGMIRFNSDTGELEGYLGGAWKTVAGNEPALKLDFDEYQFDGRISFTRATNGSYFDSAGVLTTAGSGVPRFDHRLENGTWVNKGLLIEESRSNLCIRSEELNVTGSGNWSSPSNASISTNAATAPNGVVSADKLVENTASAEHLVSAPDVSFVSGTTYTASAFFKSDGRSIRMLLPAARFSENKIVWFNLSNGTVTSTSGSGLSTSVVDYGNGWYRCSMTATATSNGTAGNSVQLVLVSTGTTTTYTGNNSSGVFIWGFQIEAGAFPTSYIATTSSAATRNADLVSMTGTNFSSWYNATEGTMFCLSDGADSKLESSFNSYFQWAVSDGTENERMNLLNIYDTETSTNKIQLFVFDNNVNQVTFNSFSGSWSTTQQYATANAYKVNDFALSTDGQSVVTDTSGTMPTPDRLYLGSSFLGNALFLNGHIAKFYYWPTRQPNAKLVSLTQ